MGAQPAGGDSGAQLRPPRAPSPCRQASGVLRHRRPVSSHHSRDALPGPRRLPWGCARPRSEQGPPGAPWPGSGGPAPSEQEGARSGQPAYPSAAPCVRVRRRRLPGKRVRQRQGEGTTFRKLKRRAASGAAGRAAARARPVAGAGQGDYFPPLALPSSAASLSPVVILDQAVAAEGA